MTSPVETLATHGRPLSVEPADRKPTVGLLRSGMARLADAHNATFSLENRFDLACNAAHALGLAAPRSTDFPACHRHFVFRVLAKAHDLRNLAEYEGRVDVDLRLVNDLIGACERVADALER